MFPSSYDSVKEMRPCMNMCVAVATMDIMFNILDILWPRIQRRQP